MDKLKRQRGTCKSTITRIKTFLDTPGTNVGKTGFKIRLANLDSAWIEYRGIHREILDIAPDEEVDAEEADYAEVEAKVCALKIGLTDCIERLRPVSTPPSPRSCATGSGCNGTSGSIGNGSTASNGIGSSGSQADVRLPRMDLPTFNGNQLEWQSFRDLFKSIVHDNGKISASQKLHNLKNSLQGEACGILQSVTITDANYQLAWDQLEERFQNERQLVHGNLKAIFSQPRISSESSSQLRSLLDTTIQHVRAINALGVQTDWDPIIIFVLVDRLDSDTRKLWELTSTAKTIPPLGELKTFLEQRCRALEATTLTKKTTSTVNQKTVTKVHQVSSKSPCPVCKNEHLIYQCPEFQQLQPANRKSSVMKMRLCFNCLNSNHGVKECKSDRRCKQCKGAHHTLLHKGQTTEEAAVIQLHGTTSNSSRMPVELDAFDKSHVLLATALVDIADRFGRIHQCRALLDSGSQSSLISSSCVKRLSLQQKRITTRIEGVGEAKAGQTRGVVSFSMQSMPELRLHALVLDTVTSNLPTAKIQTSDWLFLKNLKLADPKFDEPGAINILIGADYYDHIVTGERILNSLGIPSARSTHLGWVLSGPIHPAHLHVGVSKIVVHVSTVEIDERLKKFWELEEMTPQQHLTVDEQHCEEFFQSTYTRTDTGRFVVSLPIKEDSQPLGQSREMCVRRLHQVERRLEKNESYRQQYGEFMDQYLALGHMEKVSEISPTHPKRNYLPHHFVLKESSTTTIFRVVFDASAKTDNGVSLNDTLHTGPRLQDDLYEILLRFRLFKYVFTADITKMFRQIMVTPSDADLQLILWRSHPSQPIQEFRLKTVTYGTAPAPYLAVKTLHQLAQDEGDKFPLAKAVLLKDFYVDDVMSGSNDLNTALKTQQQLLELLATAGIPLKKWSANHEDLLSSLPHEYRETRLPLTIGKDDSIKALGLHWNPGGDYFFFKVNLSDAPSTVTKRSILSETARLFDPLGWLAPVIVVAKIQFQQLWLLGVSWDDKLPEDITNAWLNYRSQLKRLEELRLKRDVCGEDDAINQLHGFCDASERAYAAVIFLRTTKRDGTTTVKILTSKTKVAPVKKVSLPRLELCGAVLVAKLLTKVKNSIPLSLDSIHAWSDSTITLSWISGLPNRWVTFVANRVSEIQGLLDPCHWHYVPSADNPADCASRGLLPEELLNFSLWWNGPSWLKQESTFWPAPTLRINENLPETRPVKLLTAQTSTTWDLVNRFSSLTKLIRVTAFCLRFIKNIRGNAKRLQSATSIPPLTTTELNTAFLFWINRVQQEELAVTFTKLRKGAQRTQSIH